LSKGFCSKNLRLPIYELRRFQKKLSFNAPLPKRNNLLFLRDIKKVANSELEKFVQLGLIQKSEKEKFMENPFPVMLGGVRLQLPFYRPNGLPPISTILVIK
jgi:hypothetical protein